MLQRRALVLATGELAATMARDLESARDLTVRIAHPGDAALPALLEHQDVVLSGALPGNAVDLLRRLLEAGRPVADVAAPVDAALACDPLARDRQVAACVGCGSLAERLSLPASERVAALMTTAIARRLLTGDFRPHWGIWTPERLLARVGLAHGLREDLRERGIRL
jgi:hypothetical protein